MARIELFKSIIHRYRLNQIIKALGIAKLIQISLSQSLLAQSMQFSLGSRPTEVKAYFGEALQDFGNMRKFQTCAGIDGGTKWGVVSLPNLPDVSPTEAALGGKLSAT